MYMYVCLAFSVRCLIYNAKNLVIIFFLPKTKTDFVFLFAGELYSAFDQLGNNVYKSIQSKQMRNDDLFWFW